MMRQENMEETLRDCSCRSSVDENKVGSAGTTWTKQVGKET